MRGAEGRLVHAGHGGCAQQSPPKLTLARLSPRSTLEEGVGTAGFHALPAAESQLLLPAAPHRQQLSHPALLQGDQTTAG